MASGLIEVKAKVGRPLGNTPPHAREQLLSKDQWMMSIQTGTVSCHLGEKKDRGA